MRLVVDFEKFCTVGAVATGDLVDPLPTRIDEAGHTRIDWARAAELGSADRREHGRRFSVAAA